MHMLTKKWDMPFCRANLFFHLYGLLEDQQIQTIGRRYKRKLRRLYPAMSQYQTMTKRNYLSHKETHYSITIMHQRRVDSQDQVTNGCYGLTTLISIRKYQKEYFLNKLSLKPTTVLGIPRFCKYQS